MESVSTKYPKFLANVQSGPILGFLGVNEGQKQWKVSVLVVSKKSGEDKFACLEASSIKYTVLATHSFTYERFQIAIPLLEKEQKIIYQIHDRKFTFQVPGLGLPLRIATFSCNGFQSEKDEKSIGGIEKMWKSYQVINADEKPHILLFNGDQVYCDPVFDLDCLKKWFDLDPKKRLEAPFTEEMLVSISKFYETKYFDKYRKNQSLAKAVGESPSIMNWDDHDVFDGWGSYPKELQECPVFQGIYAVAKTYYLLMQQQVNPERPFVSDAFIGNNSYSMLHFAGDVVILTIDTRSRRTMKKILPEEAWKEIFSAIKSLPKGKYKHLLVMLPIPIFYPDFKKIEKLVEKGDETLQHVNEVLATFKKPSVKASFVSAHGGIDIKDDLIDHWTSKYHEKERAMLLTNLQDFAKAKECRVSFYSGDVHLAGIGESRQPGKKKKTDPLYTPQVISSPMGNLPGGKPIALYLSYLNNKTQQLGGKTSSKMVPISRLGNPLKEKILFSKRNWVQLNYCAKTHEVKVNLFVESKKIREETGDTIKVYQFIIPRIQKEVAMQTEIPSMRICNLY